MDNNFEFTQEEWDTCIKVLRILKKDPFQNPNNEQFGGLVSSIYKSAKKANRQQSYKQKKDLDISIIKESHISQMALNNRTEYQSEHIISEVPYKQLNVPKNCYCCNVSFDLMHHFYNRLCPKCADINYKNRFLKPNLKGRHILLTGGRIKIGYATALKFLRSHAHVTITTRLPALALNNFQQEADYKDWCHNLRIYGLDLRNLNAVTEFIDFYKSQIGKLDILVNNAALTIKYPDNYYLPLIQKETQLLETFRDNHYLRANPDSLLEQAHLLTSTKGQNQQQALNRFDLPVDDRIKNSWNSTLEEIGMPELLEVNLINHISPYYLIKELGPLMRNSNHAKRFIINVTSSEGQFSYTNKSAFHPHTNMTKAALNMLTRTSGEQYKKSTIYMNAVDVGWVSTGAIETLRKKQFEQGYIPPLDPVDGASRILHPIVKELETDFGVAGKLFKNYEIEEW